MPTLLHRNNLRPVVPAEPELPGVDFVTTAGKGFPLLMEYGNNHYP
jgi:hypothetical protein